MKDGCKNLRVREGDIMRKTKSDEHEKDLIGFGDARTTSEGMQAASRVRKRPNEEFFPRVSIRNTAPVTLQY